MLKSLAVLVLIVLFFNGCSEDRYITPKLTTIDPKTKTLPSRELEYKITQDGNASMKLRDAKWLVAKMNRCVRNNKKLKVANRALNEQIRINNGVEP